MRHTRKFKSLYRSAIEQSNAWTALLCELHAALPEFPRPAEQCEKLVAELPGQLRARALYSVLAGLRMAKVRDLTWHRVDLERAHAGVPPRQSRGVSFCTSEMADAFGYRWKCQDCGDRTRTSDPRITNANLPLLAVAPLL